MFNPQFVLSILLWQNNEFSYLKTNKGSFGTRTNWCVLNKELCTTGMASRGHTLRPWDLELEARRSLYPEPRSHDRFKPGASWVNRVTTMNLMHYVRDFGPEEFVVTPATVSVPNQHRNDSTSPCNSNTHLCTEDFFWNFESLSFCCNWEKYQNVSPRLKCQLFSELIFKKSVTGILKFYFKNLSSSKFEIFQCEEA